MASPMIFYSPELYQDPYGAKQHLIIDASPYPHHLQMHPHPAGFLQTPSFVPQTPPKKRKLNDDISFVEISRNELLTMTSRELEAQIAHLSAIRSLTSAEQREIKRQRRLIKNREYAQTSRVKKKQFIEELRIENKLLKDRIKMLEQENHFLRFGGASGSSANSPINSNSGSPIIETTDETMSYPTQEQLFISPSPGSSGLSDSEGTLSPRSCSAEDVFECDSDLDQLLW